MPGGAVPPPAPMTDEDRRLGPWSLEAQLGAGDDGVVYAARRDDTRVVLYDLSRAATDRARWQAIGLLLAKRRLLEHPGLLPLIDLDLSGPRPWVALPAELQRLDEVLPLEVVDTLHVASVLCHATAALHRVGLYLDHLSPDRVYLTEGRTPLIDAVGLRCSPASTSPLVDACSPAWAEESSAAKDIYGLTTLLGALTTGVASDNAVDGPLAAAPFGDLLRRGRELAPEDRPEIGQLTDAIDALIDEGATIDAAPLVSSTQASAAGSDFGALGAAVAATGRYELVARLGEGSMGAVFRARDMASGELVALKVLNDRSRSRGERARRRFKKEARLLAQLRNPHIANLLEVNFEGEVDWMAMELIAGTDLDRVVQQRGALSERDALTIMADVARGLADAHRQGIVHRDIKPSNILLRDDGDDDAVMGMRACLLDFGIAREIDQSQSLDLTRDGGIIGTPMYLPPEQAGAGELVPASDIYALGCTGYHLLTGHPPFRGKGAMELISQHLQAPPPRIDDERTDLRPEVADLFDRMLAKKASARFIDASELLVELETLLGIRAPVEIDLHPRGMNLDDDGVRSYVFEWDLAATAEQLWPYVSDTDRLNRAWGLAQIEVEHRPLGDDVEKIVHTQAAGLKLVWREHPYEWVENKRFGVLREFIEGPFRWLRSTVDLEEGAGGTGTHLVHRFDILPRGVVGRAAAALEIGRKGKKGLDRIYRRIDSIVATPVVRGDAFEAPPELSEAAERRLARGERELINKGVQPGLVERLGEFLRHAGAPDVSHIRPLELARRYGFDEERTVDALLHAAHVGLLTIHWDLVCPVCRIASEIKDTLAALKEHGHCAACNLDYDLDLAGGVEMVLRVHEAIRTPDVATYCASSPGHSPHIKARVRVDPGERMRLELALKEGRYVLAGRGIGFELPFSVEAAGGAHRWDLDIGGSLPVGLSRTLRPGYQELYLLNTGDAPRLVRIEQAPEHERAFTAARAASHATFRRLFPEQRLADGQLVAVRFCTLLVVEVADAPSRWSSHADDEVYATLSTLFTTFDAATAARGGAMVKIMGDGAVGVFMDPAGAVSVARELPSLLEAEGFASSIPLRASVHQGPARAVTLNGRLDYFGQMPRGAEALVRTAGRDELLLSQQVATDPAAARLVEGGRAEIVSVPTGGLGLRVALRK